MKLRTRTLLRVGTAILLVLIAAFSSFLIKDFIAVRNPDDAIPTLQVIYNGEPLPAQHVVLSDYEWRFMTQPYKSDHIDPDIWLTIPEAPTNTSFPLKLRFSYNCQSYKISISKDDDRQFSPLIGELKTPTIEGTYTYRVEAEWGWLGSVQYYFKLSVRSSNSAG